VTEHICTVCHQPSHRHEERGHFPALCCEGCDCGSFEEKVMTQDAEGLKACPCCNHPKPVVRHSHDEDGLKWTWVECTDCGLRTRGNWCHPENLCPQFMQERRDEWNTRAPSPVSALVECLERLERELRRMGLAQFPPELYMIHEMRDWARVALANYRNQ
jgi:hypothetical protein